MAVTYHIQKQGRGGLTGWDEICTVRNGLNATFMAKGLAQGYMAGTKIRVIVQDRFGAWKCRALFSASRKHGLIRHGGMNHRVPSRFTGSPVYHPPVKAGV